MYCTHLTAHLHLVLCLFTGTPSATPSSALQIFQKESHPSSYKLGSGAKEGLSLFGELPAPVCGHMHTVSWCTVGRQEEGLLTGWRLDSPPTVYWVGCMLCSCRGQNKTFSCDVFSVCSVCSVCVVFCVCCVVLCSVCVLLCSVCVV